MAAPDRPQLRPLEVVPVRRRRDTVFLFRDPEGLSSQVVLAWHDGVLATLMDGRRTLPEIRRAFKAQTGESVALADVRRLVGELEEAYLLEGDRFEAWRRQETERYLALPRRPAAHAGDAYPRDPGLLREELASYYTGPGGPGAPRQVPGRRRLRGVVSPHIDPRRGGPAYGWTYHRIVQETDADLFVVLGTAHAAMGNLVALTRKDFETPLGVVRTDAGFASRAAAHLASSVAGRRIDPFADEPAHRQEHSIEFQAVFLQHALGGRREFRIVPVLVGSFHDLILEGIEPDESPEIQALLAALQHAAAGHTGRVCWLAAADLAHVGPRFGDDEPLDRPRLDEQAADDRALLEAACRPDPAGFFRHVARQQDRRRICGLAPIYLLLALLAPARGELLAYHQAVEPDGSACVSFASLVFG